MADLSLCGRRTLCTLQCCD